MTKRTPQRAARAKPPGSPSMVSQLLGKNNQVREGAAQLSGRSYDRMVLFVRNTHFEGVHQEGGRLWLDGFLVRPKVGGRSPGEALAKAFKMGVEFARAKPSASEEELEAEAKGFWLREASSAGEVSRSLEAQGLNGEGEDGWLKI